MGLMDQMDLFLNLWNNLKNSLIYIFVRYLSYSLLKIHRKLTSGYLLDDKATLMILSTELLYKFLLDSDYKDWPRRGIICDVSGEIYIVEVNPSISRCFRVEL
jgi:hypothetical protein